jgi:hypothetical protein
MALREPQLIIATGRKRIGKTYTTLQVINRYVMDNPAIGKKGRKVLIYDVNQEYTQYKTMGHADIVNFSINPKVEIRRILAITPDGKIMHIDQMNDLLNKILQEFRGGLLVLEDINRYLIDTKTPEIIGTMATNAHRDLDIICHLQSLAPMTTRMWQNCSVVRFHFQMDDIFRYKTRIPNYELYKIAQCLVNYKYHGGDMRFYCWVYNEENLIKGAFTKADFRQACEDYLYETPRMIQVTQSRFGRGEEARDKAMKYLCDDFMKYYGGLI